ncbi:MAG: AAA family ATPase, partial [bacterium]
GIRPLLELKNQGRPDSQGWVLARCIETANHKHGDMHFSLRINIKTGGVRCMSQGCPVGPNLNQLAERLGVDASEKDQRVSPDDAMRRLAAYRMLAEQALRDTYGIHAASGGWAFPVDDPDAHGHPHIKRFSWWPGEPRFWWPKGSRVVAKDLVYGLSRVPDGGEFVYVAAGEIDCITLEQVGIPAISFLTGEGSEPSEQAIAKIRQHGIKELRLVYDLDDAGRSGREKVAAACAPAGLDVCFVELPASLGEGGDINDLWRSCDGDRERFAEALRACHAFFYSPESLGSVGSRRILRTFAEFVEATELEGDLEYLVEGLFPADWLLGFVGKPRVGKSLLALHLARCVATGQPFLERQT